VLHFPLCKDVAPIVVLNQNLLHVQAIFFTQYGETGCMLLGLCSSELRFKVSDRADWGNVYRENKHLLDTFYERMCSDEAVSGVGGGGGGCGEGDEKKIVMLGLSNLYKFYR